MAAFWSSLTIKILSELPDAKEKPEVILLFTPPLLNPPVSVHIKSNSPYWIVASKGGGVTVDAGPESTTKITSLQQLYIKSSAPLGPTFAQGWNSLPAELKIRILWFNLKSWRRIGMEGEQSYPPVVPLRLLPHLRMTPEIATMARDVFFFWTTNRFRVEPSWRSTNAANAMATLGTRPYFAYPPPTHNHLIRRLTVRIRPDSLEWVKLAKLANGDYGFVALREVVVELDMWFMNFARMSVWDDFWANTVRGGIEFCCAGSVRFVGTQEADYRPPKFSSEDVMKMFNDNIRFVGEGTKADS